MPHRAFSLLCTLLLFVSLASAQAPTEQPAQVSTAIDVTINSLKLTKNGLQVAISYVSHLKEPIQFTLTHPPERAGFAADNLRNEYTLVNATGMVRKHEDPHLDLTRPDLSGTHSTFLLAAPDIKVSASLLFKRTTHAADTQEQPTSFTIALSYYARPAEKFDPKQPSRAFGFTATITLNYETKKLSENGGTANNRGVITFSDKVRF